MAFLEPAIDQNEYKENENLIAAAMIRMHSFGDTPYILTGDFDVIIHNSDSI